MTSSQAKVSTVATFPPGFFLENIEALHDDTLLITVANRRCIYAVPPPAAPGHTRQPYLLYQFEDDALAFGIVTAPNNNCLTYVLTSDFISQGSCLHHLRVLDTSNVMAAGRPRTIAQFPLEAKGLNGLTALSSNVLLAADSFAGCIWRIDIRTNEKDIPVDAKITKWMEDPMFAGTLVLPDFQPGVNGLKYSQAMQTVYFSSTQRRIFGGVPVDTQSWAPAGHPTIILEGRQGDDLILDDHYEPGPVAYLTTHRENSILRIPLRPTQDVAAFEVVAEVTENDTRLLGPTSGVWKPGHKGKSAYFNCDGGLKHPLPGEPPQFARILEIEF